MVLIGYRGNLVQKQDLRTELKEWQVCEHILASHQTRNKCVIDCLQMSSLHINHLVYLQNSNHKGFQKKIEDILKSQISFSILYQSSLTHSLVKHRKNVMDSSLRRASITCINY